MRYRELGRTGLLVSELCLGTNTFGGGGQPGWQPLGGLDQPTVNALIARAIESGVNFIDTANIYGAGESEEAVGTAFKQLGIARDRLVLLTKVGMKMGSEVNQVGLSRHHIMASLDESLRRLKVDYVDVYMIHQFDRLTPPEETLETLQDLVRVGKVRYTGCSNLAAWQVMKFLGIADRYRLPRFQIMELYYSIAARDIERELVPLALDQGVSVSVWGALLGGVLTGKYTIGEPPPKGTRFESGIWMPFDETRTKRILGGMSEIAQSLNVPLAQIALAWVLAQPSITSVPFGARTMEQLEMNLAAADLQLSSEHLAALSLVSELPAEYPGWKLLEAHADRPLRQTHMP